MQQNEEDELPNLDLESSTTCASADADADDCWEYIKDNEIMQQQSAVLAEEAFCSLILYAGADSHLEHIFESQDLAEVDRIKANVENCRKTLQNLLFPEQLESILQGNEDSISHEELVQRSRDQSISNFVEPMGEESDHVHVTALSNALGVPIRVVYLDRSSCDKSGVIVNHSDFIHTEDISTAAVSDVEARNPSIALLYRSGHYDILFYK